MILSTANKIHIEKLLRNFNKRMRAVLNKQRTVNGLLNELGYLNVDREIKRDVLTFVYRIENNMLL